MDRTTKEMCKTSLEIFFTQEDISGTKARSRSARDYAFSRTPPSLSEEALNEVVATELMELKEKIQQFLPVAEIGESFELYVLFKDNFEHGRKEWAVGPCSCEIPNMYDNKRIVRMVDGAVNTMVEEIWGYRMKNGQTEEAQKALNSA